MQAEGLFSASGTNIDIRKLAKALREKVIDVELFNQLLRQDCLFEVRSVNLVVDWWVKMDNYEHLIWDAIKADYELQYTNYNIDVISNKIKQQ